MSRQTLEEAPVVSISQIGDNLPWIAQSEVASSNADEMY